MPITAKQIAKLEAIGWAAQWRKEDREEAQRRAKGMSKPKPKKTKVVKVQTHQDQYELFLQEVSGWCKSRQGRSQELATILNVDRRKVYDWFVSRRFDPPGWVVFTVPRVLIATSAPKN